MGKGTNGHGDRPFIEKVRDGEAEIHDNIVIDGKKRYYIEDLTERDYSLEYVTPFQIDLFGEITETGKWCDLLCRITKQLLVCFPEKREGLLSFHTSWSKADIFSQSERTNFKLLNTQGSDSPDIYINCNHTALHSCWLLQDLLDYFGVDKSRVLFLVHRPSEAEPKAVTGKAGEIFKEDFTEYIVSECGKTKALADEIISITEKYINPILCGVSGAYTNIFLFTDLYTLYNYTARIEERIKDKYFSNTRSRDKLLLCMKYIKDYYKVRLQY